MDKGVQAEAKVRDSARRGVRAEAKLAIKMAIKEKILLACSRLRCYCPLSLSLSLSLSSRSKRRSSSPVAVSGLGERESARVHIVHIYAQIGSGNLSFHLEWGDISS